MRAAIDVSLWSEEQGPQEPKDQFNARLPASVVAYIRKEAAPPSKRTQAAVVADAIRLDKVLAERLVEHRDDLKAFAQEHGKTLTKDLAEVLADLVVLGLRAHKKPKK